MIIVKYKYERDSPLYRAIVHRVTWLSITNFFIFYDESDKPIFNMSPYYIEVESIENHKTCLMEEENGQRTDIESLDN